MQCNTRIVTRVLKKLAEGTPPEKRREGGGRPNRIVLGSAKADVVIGDLRSGFGSKHTALFVNELGGRSTGKRSRGRSKGLGSARITFSVEVRFLRFLGHFISTFSNRNGYGKFQLLKLSFKKFGYRLFSYVQ